MTRQLEELFDMPSSYDRDEVTIDIETTKYALAEFDSTIDKIDAALPGIRGFEADDAEMDALAAKATETFDELMDLGMQVDARYSSEIFAVAGAMLGHALTARTAKLNKKLKIIQLQLQKAKLDLDREKLSNKNQDEDETIETAEGQVLSRNDLLDRLIGTRDQKNKQA
mgnify:CR=1 FL=1|jgi:hypothetical protein|tara:strand:+ start:2676 stop:3182 length:507 start_codon:yes stop_codon:yes gene_type:complete